MGARSITRDRENGMLGGVCAGIAAAYDIDVLLVRLAFVAVMLLFGVGIALYVALWLLLPASGQGGEDRAETAREGAAEMAEAARVATDRAVEASRVAADHAVEASRTASDLIQKAARSASAAAQRRASSRGGGAPEPERPEDEKNSPSGPIP